MPGKGWKIQTSGMGDWEDLVDSETQEFETYPTKKRALDEVQDLRDSLDGTRGMFRVVSVEQDEQERAQGARMIATVANALGTS